MIIIIPAPRTCPPVDVTCHASDFRKIIRRLQKLLKEGKVETSDVEHDEVDSDISENDSSSDTSSSSDSDPQPEAKRARLYDQKKLFKESESSKDDNDFYGFAPLKD